MGDVLDAKIKLFFNEKYCFSGFNISGCMELQRG